MKQISKNYYAVQHPVGVSIDAPESLSTKKGSQLMPIQTGESMGFRYLFTIDLIVLFGMIALFLAILITGFFVARGQQTSDSGMYILLAILVVTFFIGLVIITQIFHLFRKKILHSILRKHIGKRPFRLFNPSKDNFLVGIEDLKTHNRFKFIPDEIGLLNIERDRLELEMSKSRARVYKSDISKLWIKPWSQSVSHENNPLQQPHAYNYQNASLAIIVKFDQSEWGITMFIPEGAHKTPGHSARDRAEWLKAYIESKFGTVTDDTRWGEIK